MNFYKRYKNRINLILLLLIVLIAYLLFSNYLFVNLMQDDSESILREYRGDIPVSHGDVRASIDSYGSRQSSFKQNVTLDGWAIDAGGTYETIVSTKLFFVSEEHSYVVECRRGDRADVINTYHDTGLTNYDVGCRVDFSPIGMKKGIYKMGVSVTGSNGQESFIWMKAAALVDQHFRWSISGAKADNIEEYEYAPVRNSVQLRTSRNSPTLEFLGWALMDGFSSEDQTVYLEFTSLSSTQKFTYRTLSHGNYEYASSLGGEEYINSAFLCKIGVSAFPETRYFVRPIIQHGENFYAAKEATLIHIRQNQIENLVKPMLQGASYAVDAVSVDYAHGWLDMVGWVYQPGSDSKKQDVLVELCMEDGTTAVCRAEKVMRSSLREAYGMDAAYAGFALTNFDVSSFASPIVTFRILLEENGTSSAVSEQIDINIKSLSKS